MKIESRFFIWGFIFYGLCFLIYWYFARDIVGIMLFLFTSSLAILAGWYLWFSSKALYPRPEDRPDGEIDEADPEYGFFSPHSWWPLATGFAAFTFALGFIFAAWMFALGAVMIAMCTAGWVFEYYTGDHAQ
ncbi:MAG: cytochrome c oxidase subunit 4 [Actinobacteria bacterium]|nr:cytochrome c oxidase subunit 4 [Actinomycetota bacterium]